MSSSSHPSSDALALLDLLPCGLVQTDDLGHILRANRTFCQWVGYAADELVGQQRFQDLLTVGGRIFHVTHWTPLLRMQGSVSEVKLDIRHRDTSLIPIVLNGVRREQDGRIVCELAVYVARDRDKYERELLQSRTQLEASGVLERNLRQQAEEANRSKDEFLAMLGHEMRNPLAPIVTALHLMKLRGADQFANERTVIQRQVEHLTRLVDDLLDVSRITRGKVEIVRRRVSLASLVDNAIEIVSPLLEQRQHHLTVAVPTHGMMLDADPVRLSQVISNLLTNSAKYTDPHGHIEVAAGRDGDELWLRVSDDGAGIAEDVLPHVFDLFVQERQSIDRARGGLGLGLAIVHSLVTMHGGTATAESAGRGQGSRFTLRLPAAPDDAAAATATVAPEPRAPATGSKRVLVVDDNIDGADMLVEILESFGHTARVAHDGPEALRVVETFTPDVAVLDIGLPVMDGYELARRLRLLPALRTTRMVALTGYGQSTDRQRSVDAGFDAHLVKPLRPDDLQAVLDRP